MNSFTIESLLGRPAKTRNKLQSSLDWIPVIRGKLPASMVESVTAATGLSRSELLRSLGLAERTIARRKKEDGLLSQEETEKLVRFARMTVRASEVFDDDEAALDWLRTPNASLDGHRPLDLLDTEIGARLVADTLGRIEHGVFS